MRCDLVGGTRLLSVAPVAPRLTRSSACPQAVPSGFASSEWADSATIVGHRRFATGDPSQLQSHPVNGLTTARTCLGKARLRRAQLTPTDCREKMTNLDDTGDRSSVKLDGLRLGVITLVGRCRHD